MAARRARLAAPPSCVLSLGLFLVLCGSCTAGRRQLLAGGTSGTTAAAGAPQAPRGTLVAVNYRASSDSFHLVPLTHAFMPIPGPAAAGQTQLNGGAATAAGQRALTLEQEREVTRTLRAAFPSENVGWAWYAGTYYEVRCGALAAGGRGAGRDVAGGVVAAPRPQPGDPCMQCRMHGYWQWTCSNSIPTSHTAPPLECMHAWYNTHSTLHAKPTQIIIRACKILHRG